MDTPKIDNWPQRRQKLALYAYSPDLTMASWVQIDRRSLAKVACVISSLVRRYGSLWDLTCIWGLPDRR